MMLTFHVPRAMTYTAAEASAPRRRFSPLARDISGAVMPTLLRRHAAPLKLVGGADDDDGRWALIYSRGRYGGRYFFDARRRA